MNLIYGASLVAQTVKNLPAMQETWVPSLGREDLLEKGMATHTCVLAWRIPWTEEPAEHVPHNVSLTQWELPFHVEARFTLVSLFTVLVVSGALISESWTILESGTARTGRMCGNLLQASVPSTSWNWPGLLYRPFCFLGICPLDYFVDKRYPHRQIPDCYPGLLPKISNSIVPLLETPWIWGLFRTKSCPQKCKFL